jgi:hypothetical protein
MVKDKKSGVLRFASEFFVIVLGVLTALSVDAFWQFRTDRTLEGEYIAQIVEDSEANLLRIASADSVEQHHFDLSGFVLNALQAPIAPSIDSVTSWLGQRDGGTWYVSDPRLLDGTISALVQTGDLALLRDPAVRSAILAYSSQLRDDMEEFRRFVQYSLDANTDAEGRAAERLVPSLAPNADLGVRTVLALHNNPEGFFAFQRINGGYGGRIWYLNELRQATETLLEALR